MCAEPDAAAGREPAHAVAPALAVIVTQVIDPASKLATAGGLDTTTAACSLGPVPEFGAVDEQELHAALDSMLGQ